ncbi:lasso peptide biosynthesis B2 protein [Phosphitispora sp. TUW77]|uniref:lasso peptide biosynthesis B2 protein n=1 Tax=Phosphitispora sp. TUW77 TaxID=3152361 RepID=UPI003AB8E367
MSLNRRTKLLFIEAYLYLGWARFLVYLPFSWVAPYLGEQMRESPFCLERAHIITIKHIYNAIKVMSRHTLWESACLVRAIAALKMLQRRNIESTLYLGTAKDENAKLIAHAWLRSGPFYITGAEEMKKFAVAGKISPMIKNS